MSLNLIGESWRLGMAFGTALGLSIVLTPVVRWVAVRYGWIGRPADGRWGKRVTARLGGVAIFVSFASSLFFWVPINPTLIGLLIGVGLVFVVGLVDDVKGMPPYVKLLSQLLIGCVVVIGGIRFDLPQWPWLSIPLSILWLVLIMNAFNLLDNMDGLAAGIGAIAAGFCAVHAAFSGQMHTLFANAILCGACIGFLRFNFPPAKIYMGDSGSHFLGLSLASLSMLGTWHNPTQLLSVLAVPSLVLAVPIFDTCFVTVQRLLNRKHPFVGGTDHLSHRLAILGLSTRQTVIVLYVFSAGLGLMSVATLILKPLTTLVMWSFAVMVLLLIGRYLAQVNVYRLEKASKPSDSVLESRRPVTLIETMLLHKRRLLEILVDFVIISIAYVLAHLLRFEGVLTGDVQKLVIQSLPIVLAVKLTCFSACGLYRGIWRYLGFSDIITVARAVTLGSILSALALLYLWRFEGFSRAVIIIDWMLTFLAVGGSRILERLFDEWIGGVVASGIPVVIFGAGDTGARVLRLVKYEKPSTRKVVGFLDDDVRKHGSRIHGKPVIGGRDIIREAIQHSHVREILIAINDPPGELLQYIRECCEPHDVSWRVVTAGVMNTV